MSKKQIALVTMLLAAASPMLWAGSVETKFVETQPATKDWSFNLSTYAWLTSISGTISAGGRSADVDVPFSDVVSHLDMVFMGSAELRYKRWGFMGDIIYARLHDDIPPPAGVLFSSTHEVVKETIGTFLLSYRAVDYDRTYLDVFAGARVYSFYSEIVLRPNLAPVGFAADGTTTWADPIVGLRGRCYLSNLFFVNGYGDVGGFGAGSELSWQVLGTVGIQAARWCDVQMGYRALGFEYQGQRGTQEMTTHGPIMGATIRF